MSFESTNSEIQEIVRRHQARVGNEDGIPNPAIGELLRRGLAKRDGKYEVVLADGMRFELGHKHSK